jgi:metal-responsive CopG/Arc/MetJ family transcriptional regulator
MIAHIEDIAARQKIGRSQVIRDALEKGLPKSGRRKDR